MTYFSKAVAIGRYFSENGEAFENLNVVDKIKLMSLTVNIGEIYSQFLATIEERIDINAIERLETVVKENVGEEKWQKFIENTPKPPESFI